MEFIDAQWMHKKHPETFDAPDMSDLDLLHANDYVKVGENKERFWVRLTEVNGDLFKGIVDNDLVFPHDFKCGDTIQFEKKNILDFIIEN